MPRKRKGRRLSPGELGIGEKEPFTSGLDDYRHARELARKRGDKRTLRNLENLKKDLDSRSPAVKRAATTRVRRIVKRLESGGGFRKRPLGADAEARLSATPAERAVADKSKLPDEGFLSKGATARRKPTPESTAKEKKADLKDQERKKDTSGTKKKVTKPRPIRTLTSDKRRRTERRGERGALEEKGRGKKAGSRKPQGDKGGAGAKDTGKTAPRSKGGAGGKAPRLARLAPIGAVVEKYKGAAFPASATGVRGFLKDLGIIGKADDISMVQAQRIANKLRSVPIGEADKVLSKVGVGLRGVAKSAPSGGVIAGIMGFFGIQGDKVTRGESLLRKGGEAWSGAGVRRGIGGMKGVARTVPGAVGVFSLANMLRKVREGKTTSRELTMQESTAPTVGDMVSQSLLRELQMRSAMRVSGQAGAPPIDLDALLGPEPDPLGAVSIPPSRGFPVG